jgi:hypothetical protein
LYEDANRAIWSAYRRSRRHRASRGHYPAVIHAIDQLLFELEELNLSGVDRVPSALRERSSRVLAFVPVEDPEEIRVRFRVVSMMDTLFHAQELVFRAKDPSRPVELDEEERSA